MPVVIQPWDREYWSKGARKRLFDEYAQGELERKKNLAAKESELASGREEAADQRRRQREMEQQSADFANRLTALKEEYGLRGQFEEGPSLRAKSALLKEQSQLDANAVGKKQAFDAAEAQKERDAAMARISAKDDKEDKDAAEYFRGEALRTLRDKGNVPEADVYRLGEELTQQAMQNRRGLRLGMERARMEYGAANPNAQFPGVYATDAKTAMADKKAASTEELFNRLGVGGVAAPAGPPVQLKPLQGGERIKLGAPKRRTAFEDYLNMQGY